MIRDILHVLDLVCAFKPRSKLCLGRNRYVLDKNEDEWPVHPFTCTAGTVVIIHYDLYHAATANVTEDTTRHMYQSSRSYFPHELGQINFEFFLRFPDCDMI